MHACSLKLFFCVSHLVFLPTTPKHNSDNLNCLFLPPEETVWIMTSEDQTPPVTGSNNNKSSNNNNNNNNNT